MRIASTLQGIRGDRFRLVLRRLERKPGLENATCKRTLWPNGTLFEMVRFNKHNDHPGELTAEELDRWVESVPMHALPNVAPDGRRSERTKMIGRNLTLRLEELESRIRPVVGEPMVIAVDFVDADGTVVDHKDFTVHAPAPKVPGQRKQPWRHR